MLFLVGSQQVLWRHYRGLNNSPLVITPINLYTSYGLNRHQVVVDCRMKRVTLRTPSGEEVTFIGERSNHLSNVISVTTARRMVRKGCEAYLA